MFFFALLSSLSILVVAQQGDPTKEVCRRHGHQTCIVDSKLYVDGGLAYWGGDVNNNSQAVTNNWLLWEDVSKAGNTEFGFPEQQAISKDPNVPLVSNGVLWPDNVNKLFYLFGGEHHDYEDLRSKNSGGRFTLWYFDTIYNTWNMSSYHSSQQSVKWPVFGAGAVSEAGTAYHYGGYLTNLSDFGRQGPPVMQSALISYDLNKRAWINDTGGNPTPRAEGSLHYLPTSDAGLLVYFGGLEGNSSTGGATYANMSQIQLYDIASQKWYTQEATAASTTGNLPQPRRGFCGGATWAKDRSSYNIYIFGGFGDPKGTSNSTALGDVWVLSIPSFQWMPVWPIPDELTFPGGKGWSSCNVFRQSQMLIIGGKLTNTSSTTCDIPNIGGQHNMWLGQESFDYSDSTTRDPVWWHAPWDNITEYRVPDLIATRIGGGTEGRATKTAPAAGWATSDLSTLLNRQFTAASREPWATSSGRLSQSTSSAAPTPKKSNVGAIAGGAVGGAVVLICIIAGALFCLRRRKPKQTTQERGQPSETVPTPDPRSPDMTQKSLASASIMQGSTLASPTPQSPAYSPQASPPPTSSPWRTEMHMPNSYYQGSPSPNQGSPSPHHMSGDWGQHAGFAQSNTYPPGIHSYQQTYYPPPPDPSMSPNKESFAHMDTVQEMPNVRSPANVVAEMSDVRSPAPRY